MEISLTFTPSLEEKAASFRRLAESGIYESLGRLAGRVDDIMLSALQDEAPVRTGAYRQSIYSVQHGGQGEIVLQFRAADPLSTFIIHGTQPHDIVATGKALAFFNAAGELVFAHSVHHPGTQPNDYPARAWQSSRDQVLDELRQTGRDIIEQVL